MQVHVSLLSLFRKGFFRCLSRIPLAAPFLFFALIFLAGGRLGRAALTRSIWHRTKSYTVCLDAGHGGEDPGKVSASGVQEKDINLAVAKKCAAVLRAHGLRVIMTREEDVSLADPSSTRHKASDLLNRRLIMTGAASSEEDAPNSGIDCAVSIHQNSFPDESQHGAQVFYNGSYEKSKALATWIQSNLKSLTSMENTRQIKENHSYYLLRDTEVPTVIAELCFLSNPSEAASIQEDAVQERAAFSLATGILQFLHGEDG